MAETKNTSSSENSTINSSTQQNHIVKNTVNVLDDSISVNEEVILSVEDTQDYRYKYSDAGDARKVTTRETFVTSEVNTVKGSEITDNDSSIAASAKFQATSGIAVADDSTQFLTAKKKANYADPKSIWDTDVWSDSFFSRAEDYKNGRETGALISSLISDVGTGVSYGLADSFAGWLFGGSSLPECPFEVKFFYTSDKNIPSALRSTKLVKRIYRIRGLELDKFQKIDEGDTSIAHTRWGGQHNIKNARAIGSIAGVNGFEYLKNDILNNQNTIITIARFLKADEIDKPLLGKVVSKFNDPGTLFFTASDSSLLEVYESLTSMSQYNLKLYINYKPNIGFTKRAKFFAPSAELNFYAQNCRLVSYRLGAITDSSSTVIEEMKLHIGNMLYEQVGDEDMRYINSY